MAMERPDDRTMPLPRTFRTAQVATVQAAPPADAPAARPASPPEAAATPEAPASAPAPEPTPAPAPRTVSVPRRTVIPPPPTGRMLDAFTAEDTEDIMLSSVVAEPVTPQVTQAPPAESFPAVEAVAVPVTASEAASAAPAEEAPAAAEVPAAPPAEQDAEDAQAEPPRNRKKPRAALKKSFLARESRIFSLVMLFGALLLTVILIIGIITARSEEKAETAHLPHGASAVLSLEGPYAS